jgi:alpha-glucuronidase
VREWKALRGRVDEQRYREVLAQLEYQAGQAEVWRDAVANWFLRESGIPDAKGRVGHYPGRFEAEAMQVRGYQVRDVTPWEAASGGKVIECPASRECTATLRYTGAPGRYTIRVQYFDPDTGVERLRLSVGNQVIDDWNADLHLPTRKIDGSSSMRHTISGVALRSGDDIGIQTGAALDYIELLPDK